MNCWNQIKIPAINFYFEKKQNEITFRFYLIISQFHMSIYFMFHLFL